MTANINIYAHPKAESWPDIEQAIKTANGLQRHFRFNLVTAKKWIAAGDADVSLKRLKRRISRQEGGIEGLIFCEGAFSNGFLVNEFPPKRIFVSCYIQEVLDAPPFRLYMLYQIAAAALTLTARLSKKLNEDMTHQPPVGCLWDWWVDSNQQSAAMVAARICPRCKFTLQYHFGVPDEAIISTQAILDYIRRTMMGESPEIANRIFIAYGHGKDWERLRQLLEKWGLQVEHFNRESVAGLLVTDRWRQMLNRSRFAFAVMTPDDKVKNGKRRARQNVIHEIGLCHARIGLHNTAILIAKGTAPFSNVDGVNYIGFEPGKLLDQAPTIRKLLEDRGIL